MDLLLILIYVAFCYAIFKIFKIKVNQWSLATATLGGIIGLSLLLLAMNYNHPYTKNGRIMYAVTPILPGVRGHVIDVPVSPNKPLKKDDVLFRIDPVVFEAEVASGEALVKEAQANRDNAKQAFDRFYKANSGRSAPFSQLDVENKRGVYLAAEAALENAKVQLALAKSDLEKTVVRAPEDGFVTQVSLRPGMYVVPMPLRPVMSFVSTDKENNGLFGAFQQNTLQRVKEGDDAEIAFDGVPGKVFKGKVRIVLDTIAAGQLQPTGVLQDFGARVPGGRALARIDILEDTSKYQLPLGSAAQIAIYTDHLHHLSMLRKVLLRMTSWKNYLYFE